jgi:hypothetical protein
MLNRGNNLGVEMRCPNGHVVEKGERFCGRCGAPIADENPQDLRTEPGPPVATGTAAGRSNSKVRVPIAAALILMPLLIAGIVVARRPAEPPFEGRTGDRSRLAYYCTSRNYFPVKASDLTWDKDRSGYLGRGSDASEFDYYTSPDGHLYSVEHEASGGSIDHCDDGVPFKPSPALQRLLDQGSTTTRARVAATPTTATAVASAQGRCNFENSDRISPEEAALCLYSHWKKGDRNVPAHVASQQAIDQAFAEAWRAPDGQPFVGCNSDTSGRASEVCEFEFGDRDTIQMYVDGTVSAGWEVVAVGHHGNPPGWKPVD